MQNLILLDLLYTVVQLGFQTIYDNIARIEGKFSKPSQH